jgi:hypothetical protein
VEANGSRFALNENKQKKKKKGFCTLENFRGSMKTLERGRPFFSMFSKIRLCEGLKISFSGQWGCWIWWCV